MSKRDEYRQFATTSLELAEKTSNAHKMRLLLMAEAWLDLAERTARLPKQLRGRSPIGQTGSWKRAGRAHHK